jgi:transposase-like protein
VPHAQPESTSIAAVLELLTEQGFDGMSRALQILLDEAMKLERSAFLGAAPYERSEQRRGHANGFKPKRVRSRLGELDLSIPQVRGVEGEGFYPRALERGVRSERALKLAVAEMYVQGVSTRKVAQITQELCGLDVSSSQVSRAAAALDEELAAWRNRPLGQVPYLLLDARYEKVRHGGAVVDAAVLLAAAVLPDGRRSLLGVSVALSEAEVHWRSFLEQLQDRGMHGVQLVVADDHAGLKAAREARLVGVPWQRCQFHLQQNATAYVPQVSMRTAVARDLRSIFDAADRAEADRLLQLTAGRWQKSAPRLAAWMEQAVPEGLTVFALPVAHRRRLRTTNMLERLNREIRRRTAVATLFPNEASLLRLVSAVLVEVCEEWETGRKYLTMDQE